MRNILNWAASALVFVSMSALGEGTKDSHIVLSSSHFAGGEARLVLRDFFIETEAGKVGIPLLMDVAGKPLSQQISTPDGRVLRVSVKPDGDNFAVRFDAKPSVGIAKWGFAVDAEQSEYFTGLMERVVDGPQRDSW